MQLVEFTDLILPLKNKLFRLALCIVRNPEEAEDIIQEVMLKIWNGERELKDIQNINGYCAAMTKNLALDHIRRKDFHTIRFHEETHEMIEDKTPASNLLQEEKIKLVREKIACLSENKRLLVQLRDIEGESYKQIAELMEISESQVKTNLFRARQELKQLLEKNRLNDE